jgi:hypothetical protein
MQTLLHFYVPDTRAEELPRSIDEYWAWVRERTGTGEPGRYVWTVKTYLYLKAHGLSSELTSSLPASGVVISHRDYLPIFLRPRPDVFLVCIKPDRKEHPWAHYYVAQNPSDEVFRGRNRTRAAVVGHWPQGGLIPRREERGVEVCNVAYYGRTVNLAEELCAPTWAAHASALGFDFRIVPSAEWHDYSRTDVTVSVRGFGAAERNVDPLLNPDSKPPSKLINSWLAGVPAVVGRESAFHNVRRSDLDYLEVRSVGELTEALLRLREDHALYEAMVANGRVRAAEFSTEAVAGQWKTLIEREVLPRYQQWMKRPPAIRQAINLGRAALFLANPRQLAAVRIYRARSASVSAAPTRE